MFIKPCHALCIYVSRRGMTHDVSPQLVSLVSVIKPRAKRAKLPKMYVYPERNRLGFQHVVLHDGCLHYARQNGNNLDLVDDYIPWLRSGATRARCAMTAMPHCRTHRPRRRLHGWGTIDYRATSESRVISERANRRSSADPLMLFMPFHFPFNKFEL